MHRVTSLVEFLKLVAALVAAIAVILGAIKGLPVLLRKAIVTFKLAQADYDLKGAQRVKVLAEAHKLDVEGEVSLAREALTLASSLRAELDKADKDNKLLQESVIEQGIETGRLRRELEGCHEELAEGAAKNEPKKS